MAGVAGAEWTLAAASELMGGSYRQDKRIWRRYQDEGAAGPGDITPLVGFVTAAVIYAGRFPLATKPNSRKGGRLTG